MKIFQCGNCQHPLFFENYACENCGHHCGYRHEDRMMLTFDPASEILISDREQLPYKFCKNNAQKVCNWLLPVEDPNRYCHACQLNRTIPNLVDEANFDKWKELEISKHRLIYQLQRLGLPTDSKLKVANGLCFDFVARQKNTKLMTGHARGVITILIREADSVHREHMRKELSELYRTLIGHLRHEVGHYYWDQIVYPDSNVVERFRQMFGDERADYRKSLQAYYATGAIDNWSESHISPYATSHPWEDWAETWAHYLHIMDMVETAHFFGLIVDPSKTFIGMKAKVSFDPYTQSDFDEIIHKAVPVSFAVNSINRAMGIPDVYPFVISPGVVQKMKFIHQLVFRKEG
jgi:hypothetical protein